MTHSPDAIHSPPFMLLHWTTCCLLFRSFIRTSPQLVPPPLFVCWWQYFHVWISRHIPFLRYISRWLWFRTVRFTTHYVSSTASLILWHHSRSFTQACSFLVVWSGPVDLVLPGVIWLRYLSASVVLITVCSIDLPLPFSISAILFDIPVLPHTFDSFTFVVLLFDIDLSIPVCSSGHVFFTFTVRSVVVGTSGHCSFITFILNLRCSLHWFVPIQPYIRPLPVDLFLRWTSTHSTPLCSFTYGVVCYGDFLRHVWTLRSIRFFFVTTTNIYRLATLIVWDYIWRYFHLHSDGGDLPSQNLTFDILVAFPFTFHFVVQYFHLRIWVFVPIHSFSRLLNLLHVLILLIFRPVVDVWTFHMGVRLISFGPGDARPLDFPPRFDKVVDISHSTTLIPVFIHYVHSRPVDHRYWRLWYYHIYIVFVLNGIFHIRGSFAYVICSWNVHSLFFYIYDQFGFVVSFTFRILQDSDFRFGHTVSFRLDARFVTRYDVTSVYYRFPTFRLERFHSPHFDVLVYRCLLTTWHSVTVWSFTIRRTFVCLLFVVVTCLPHVIFTTRSSRVYTFTISFSTFTTCGCLPHVYDRRSFVVDFLRRCYVRYRFSFVVLVVSTFLHIPVSATTRLPDVLLP